MFLVAIAFITIGGLADAFDGIVARVQQKESRYGDFLAMTLIASAISVTAFGEKGHRRAAGANQR